MAFVHLHNHSEYSLLDGAARVGDLIVSAKQKGMPAVALTDHGVMYGALYFYKQAIAQGIKPIIGCEVYVAPRTRFDRDPVRDKEAYHLVLLAENIEGYKNLCKLVSLGFIDGFYYKPRVDKALLRRYARGLIALSGCIAGEIPDAFLSDEKQRAKELALEYRDIFGAENFFLEIQDHGMGEEKLVNSSLMALSAETGIEMVATNDLHYINRDDATVHDILLCVQTGKLRSDEQRMRFPSSEFYLKTEEEMRALFAWSPNAADNTVRIADRCRVDFNFGGLFMPNYEIPQGFTLHGYLRHLCGEGLLRRYPSQSPDLTARLEYELGIIEKTGFSGYFLIVWDIINFSRKNGVLVGPGRGSAAGSLVAYVLGITNIDPIKYQLLFERFLNPERVSPPDIDIDFCYENRFKVIDYLVEKYGESKVCQIITFGTMKAKSAVKDVARVLSFSYAEANNVAKLIPEELDTTLDSALKGNSELRNLYESDPAVKDLLDISRKIEGMPRHHSKHAAGVVIAADDVIEYIPVQKTGDVVVTQFEKEQVEECGLLKVDILGLRTLTVIGDAVENIRLSRGADIDIDNLPLDDGKTYAVLQDGATAGVFQLESDGMRKVMRDLRPERLEDIIALIALYRPGPLEGGMVEDFIAFKHGQKNITYMHPKLESILKETYGVIVYQEQVMQIASALAGFSLGQSDLLRKAMGKKNPEILAKERSHFVEGCVENKVNKKKAEEIFDLMEKFAGYGFNKSHSAAYALVAYQTAWLKANYPAEFLAAMLTSVMDNLDKVRFFREDCDRLGILILPPNINGSMLKFTVKDDRIIFGLAAVKNIGRDTIEAIIKERMRNGDYQSLEDLARRVSLNKKVLESLIKCGALDCFGQKRAQLMMVIERTLELGKRESESQSSLQASLFDFGLEINDKEQPSIVFPDIAEFAPSALLAMEREMVGFYISGHPLDEYQRFFDAKRCRPIVSVFAKPEQNAAELNGNKTNLRFGGVISGYKQLITKKGDPMATFVLEDKEASIKCVVFPQCFSKHRRFLYNGCVVMMDGKLMDDDGSPKLMVNEVAVAAKVYIRIDNGADAALLDALRDAARAHPGPLPVMLFYKEEGIWIELSDIGGADPGDRLVKSLEGLVGEGNVRIK